MIAKRALSAVTLTFLSCLAACSTVSGETEDAKIGTARSAVINGKPSDDSQDAVVLIVHYDPDDRSGGVGQCTGTLLAPRLVLTARHCVGDTDPVAACKSDGTPIQYGVVRGNHDPSTLMIFTGKERPDFTGRSKIKPAAHGVKIIDDGAKNLCNHDIALILLEEEITDVPIAPIRLDADVTKGELITAVGWGVTEDSPQPEQRMQRTNVKVKDVGPSKSTMGVPPNEFEVGESICSGDSGGPAIAQKTKAVVGVVSRGGNGNADADPNDPAANCINGSNLYTKVSAFKDLILKAYGLAEADPWLEGGADPRLLKPAAACSRGEQCRSNLCLDDPNKAGRKSCAEDCSATGECSTEGDVCTAEEDAMVCRPPPPPVVEAPKTITTGGCSTSGSSSNGTMGVLLAALALVGLRRRRNA